MTPARSADLISIPLLAVVATASVLATVALALPQSFGSARLGAFESELELDYEGASPRLPELTEAFVARALGRRIDGGVATASRLDMPPRVGSTRALAPPLSPNGASPDDFERAMWVDSLPFAASVPATETSREDGEPSACAPTGGGTAWFAYQPAADESIVATTAGSTTATALALYEGTTLADLRSEECDSSLLGNARLSSVLRRGRIYMFQVTAIAGAGTLSFRLSRLGTTVMVSRDTTGDPADGDSISPALSADGRFVAFSSRATNLSGDRPGCVDCPLVFVHDRLTGTTTLESVADDGSPANDHAVQPAISADGRYVVFVSGATNLGAGQPSNVRQVWLRDRSAGTTVAVSVTDDGELGDSPSYTPQISADGTRIVFASWASNLRPDGGVPCPLACVSIAAVDTQQQVYLHDRRTGRTTFQSGPASGEPPDSIAQFPAISGDGSIVAFVSSGSAMLADESSDGHPASTMNARGWNVYVRDTRNGDLRRVSHSPTGEPTEGAFYQPTVSFDGQRVAFTSGSPNLVPDDTNGQVDVFLWDAATDTVRRASVSTDGAEASSPDKPAQGQNSTEAAATAPRRAVVSANGRFVVFDSDAIGLVPEDTNGLRDVFRHDVATGVTERVSLATNAAEGTGDSVWPTVSAHGTVIAFASSAEDLVVDDNNLAIDVFVHQVGGS